MYSVILEKGKGEHSPKFATLQELAQWLDDGWEPDVAIPAELTVYSLLNWLHVIEVDAVIAIS